MPSYKYPRPAVTVDSVVFGFNEAGLHVLLVKRPEDATDPFPGMFALPGTYLHEGESLQDAATRALEDKTGAKNAFVEQLFTFGELDRDPRERTISVAYFALVSTSAWGRLASDTVWCPIKLVPTLAFDHNEIIKVALERLRGKVRYQPIGFELLPAKFTLSQLQSLYEALLGGSAKIDKRNFRKKILATGLLRALDETTQSGAHRPAQLFQFDRKKYDKLRHQPDFHFDI